MVGKICNANVTIRKMFITDEKIMNMRQQENQFLKFGKLKTKQSFCNSDGDCSGFGGEGGGGGVDFSLSQKAKK